MEISRPLTRAATWLEVFSTLCWLHAGRISAIAISTGMTSALFMMKASVPCCASAQPIRFAARSATSNQAANG
jgi:hypothetical protein